MKEDKEHRPKEKRVTLLTPPGATGSMTVIKGILESNGQEYPAIVEFAPFQKAAKKKTKKRDTKVGTIDDDPEYRKFLESYATDNEKMTSTPETLLEEIEAKNRELIAKKTTPLLSFLKNKQRMREEKREERRRREIERKRQREEERRKWKEEEKRKRKDIEKLKKIDRIPERDKLKDEPKIKVHRFLLQAVNQKNVRTKYMIQSIYGYLCAKMLHAYVLWRFAFCLDKGKKAESTESIGSSEKTEKKEEVVKRDRIRNKDRPAMQLYQPGARSRNRLCPPDDSTKSGDSAVERKQESGISHRKEGGEE
ncbi:regulator of nonsense transcripts 3B [Cebus imitator]|uniref:regulator of nonsense transcripts 3B n=1 Tax=Cebus imitator TaxID=2715852 RepID=UPI00189B9C86|nr:regulator of nonsense transcripts 3B [Cebus imitator]